jgi:hypothetical protein
VQPLLITLIGVVAWPAILIGINFVRSRLDPCPGCEVGYGIVMALIETLLLLAAGWLVIGFIVGWSSPDYRLALRAIGVAALILSAVVTIMVMAFDASGGGLDADQFRDDLLTFPLAGLLLVFVVGIGSAAGGFLRTRRGRAAP